MSDTAPLAPIGFYKSGRPIFPILGGATDDPPAGTPAPPAPPASTDDPPAPPAAQPTASTDGGDKTDWKTEARKWEERAKANKEAKDALDALTGEKQTLEQALAEVKKTADEKAAEAARYKVAATKGLPVDLLPEVGDEAALTAFADKLLEFKGGTGSFVVPGVGGTPPKPPTAGERARAAEASGDLATALAEKAGQIAALAQGQTT